MAALHKTNANYEIKFHSSQLIFRFEMCIIDCPPIGQKPNCLIDGHIN